MAVSSHPHRSPVAFCVKAAIWIPVAMVALFAAAPAAKTEPEGASAPNRDNVLVMRQRPGEMFSRWVGTPAAAAAGTRTTQRPPRVRIVKAKKPSEPPAAPAQQPAPQAAQSAWPSAAATTGTAAILPITVKTVRELIAPPADTPLVFESELSDIDLAARPARAASPAVPAPPSTDGRSFPEADDTRGEQPLVLAMSESMRSIAQAAWFEPLLLALAGALAALMAMRVFARA